MVLWQMKALTAEDVYQNGGTGVVVTSVTCLHVSMSQTFTPVHTLVKSSPMGLGFRVSGLASRLAHVRATYGRNPKFSENFHIARTSK